MLRVFVDRWSWTPAQMTSITSEIVNHSFVDISGLYLGSLPQGGKVQCVRQSDWIKEIVKEQIFMTKEIYQTSEALQAELELDLEGEERQSATGRGVVSAT
ncbi:putative ribonuclease D [Trichinella spiralis]|uniref:putative ribonuclease D n=1 Tax=Trichinella spiralis TaxID=6334 RepID=UPI0001EFE1E6|nr:putative ribonuclease D [Trichinella spiralis]